MFRLNLPTQINNLARHGDRTVGTYLLFVFIQIRVLNYVNPHYLKVNTVFQFVFCVSGMLGILVCICCVSGMLGFQFVYVVCQECWGFQFVYVVSQECWGFQFILFCVSGMLGKKLPSLALSVTDLIVRQVPYRTEQYICTVFFY